LQPASLPLRIVKVGGSLLAWPGLPQALNPWLADQPSAIHVLLCGGGAIVDALRAIDQSLHLPAQAMHWLAIDAMSLTARMLAEATPKTPLFESYDLFLARLSDRATSGALLFDAREFLRHHEPHLPGTRLPQNWDVTSDSIAARLAEATAANELVLLKSSVPPAATREELAAAGYVDRHFPMAARALPRVSFVNLKRLAAYSPLATQSPRAAAPRPCALQPRV
jgi:aspartokinase-like uncharacterized kinase